MSKSYTIDFETIGLNRGLAKAYNEHGKTNILNPNEAFLQFGHIDITQIAIHDSETNIIKHFGVGFNQNHKMPSFVDKSTKHTRHLKGFGNVDAYHISNYGEKDISDLFKQPWSKMKGAKGDWYKEKIMPGQLLRNKSTLFKLPSESGNDIFIAESNLELALKSGDMSVKNGRLVKGTEKELSKFFTKDVEYSGDLTYKQFQVLLENNAKNMIKNGSKASPIAVAAWNPYFDINNYMAQLIKMGNPDLAEQLHKAYTDGIIRPEELERTYKAFLYQLGKENPELGNMLRIGYNPVAAAATGRPGKLAKTFEEFQYVGGYKAEQAANIVSKHFGIDLTQSHSAGADVFTEREIQKAIVKKIEEAGLTVDGIIKGDTHGNLSKLLEKENRLGGVLDDLVRQYKPMAESMSKYPSMHHGNKVVNEVKSAFKGAKGLRLGAVGTLIGLGLAATYGFGGSDDLYPFSDKMKIKNFGSAKAPNYSTYFEDNHNNLSQAGTVLKTTIGAGALLYGVGAYAKLTSPKTLGVMPKFGVFDTIGRGIRQIEGAHQITRVLQISSTIDYIRGAKGRDTVFKTIDNGSIVGGKTKLVKPYTHDLVFDNILDDAKQFNTADEYKTLSEWLKPTTTKGAGGKDLSTRQIKFHTNEHGMLVVYKKDFASGVDEAIDISKEITIPVNYKRIKNRTANISMAHQIDRYKKSFSERHPSNSITHQLLQNDQIDYGRAKWLHNFDDWMKGQELPSVIKNNPGLEWMHRVAKRVQHKLELGPKGIGENANIFAEGMPKLSSSEGTFFRKTKILLPGHEAENIGLAYKNVMMPMRNQMLTRFNKFLESPFETGIFGLTSEKLDKVANGLIKSAHIVPSLGGRALKFINRPHLGLAEYNMRSMGFLEYGAKFGLKRVLPVMAGFEGLRLADHLLGALTMSSTGRGPIFDAPIRAYQGLSLLYSKISDITGFTRLTKRQEKVAPGSTHLGILAPALTTYSMYRMGGYLSKKGPMGMRVAMSNAGKRISQFSLIKNALRPEAYAGALKRGPLERYTSWALKNPKSAIFSFMMLPMLPFLPGALGSNKSYAERKAEFAGDKEVAIRKYRGWLLSSSPYEGGKPIQFRKHMTNILHSDYENKGVLYPNYWERFLHNVTFGLYKPYILENYHAKDQPVYQSAQYGANIPLIGQPIAATIGRIIKPSVTYHKLSENFSDGQQGNYPPGVPGGSGVGAAHISNLQLAKTVGIKDEGSNKDLLNRWSRQYHDLIGFTGFGYETAKEYLTGSKPGELTPYKENAGEMYNPAQQMWGWHLGDITGFGGEFLRRLFPFPQKNWKVNDIPNELHGVSWIPQESTKKDAFKRYENDVTHGTTFDNAPLGWLYASRKGWENLYPQVKGKELEEYPDPVRLEVLQSIAPFTEEFRQQSRKVMNESLQNQLSLSDEQRFYETLNQVRQLKDKLYVNRSEYNYRVKTEGISGTVTALDESGAFSIDGDDTKYRLAGVSTSEADIRANLLLKEKFDSTSELANRAAEIKQRTSELISQRLGVGSKVSFQAPDASQMNDAGTGIEAIVGDLNSELRDAGAPMVNTGNLSEFNMQQDQVGYSGRAMAKYWGVVANNSTFWANKLIPQRDYMANYLQNQVFNREVKLWSHPIKQLLAPAIASFAHQWLGVDKIPEFTMERRRNQEYWDILKYVKYKMLAVQASKSGDEESASYYHNMWRSTMVGADPTDDNTRDELAALPDNERSYYSRFVNEPDEKKRGKIMKYIPRGARRIYSAIWNKKIAESSNDPDDQALYQNIQETEGWGMSDREEKMYQSETGGAATKADWIRARYVREYMKSHEMPGNDWIGYSADVDLENVELLSLKEGGENIQDYGFFDNKLREAIYDQGANLASHQLKSVGKSSRALIENTVAYIIQDDRASEIAYMPTMSQNPIRNVNVTTNGHDDFIAREQNPQTGGILHEAFSFNY